MERLEERLRTSERWRWPTNCRTLRVAAPACLGRRWSTAAGASVDRRPDGPFYE